MVRYYCRNCSFKYSPKMPKARPPERCGNCGAFNSLSIEPDANQIIKESN